MQWLPCCRYRLEYVADDTRVRKAVDSNEADGALPAKRLCMSNGLDSPEQQQEQGTAELDQLMQTNRVGKVFARGSHVAWQMSLADAFSAFLRFVDSQNCNTS